MGKIYHVGIDDPASWTVPAWHCKNPRYGPATRAAVDMLYAARAAGAPVPDKGPGSTRSLIPVFEAIDCADDDLTDGDTAVNAIAQLKEHALHSERPFFLAVGFANEFLPKDTPKFAATAGMDFFGCFNVPGTDTVHYPGAFKRECLHGYLAAISYVDAQVGRLDHPVEPTNAPAIPCA